LVQGASVTDLIPHYTQSSEELGRAIKARAVACLARQGYGLAAVAEQYYATLLAVTGRARGSLRTEEREAWSKAAHALGYRITEVALLCKPELGESAFTPDTLQSYAQALNAEAVVLLERNLLPQSPVIPWTRIAVCDDFFGSLGDPKLKRVAWQQLQSASHQRALGD
jgi:hypothetical protein